MNIVEKTNNKKHFCDMPNGEVFKVPSGVYMKTENIQCVDGQVYNCVNLKNGILCTMSLNSVATVVDHELVLTEGK